MPSVSHLPRVDDLSAAPELAVLTALEATAHTARLALFAVFPECQCGPAGHTDELRIAMKIVDAANRLIDEIHHYHLALAVTREHEREQRGAFPF